MSSLPPPRSLSRGLHVLRLVARSAEGLSHGALAQALRLPNATINRLLAALLTLGWLVKDSASGRYLLGPEFAALVGREDPIARLRRCAAPFLAELHATTANTVLLLRWDGRKAVCIERLLHEDSVVLQAPGHRTRELHDAPWGVFCLSRAQWERALRRSPPPPGARRRRYEKELRRLEEFGFCSVPTADKQRLAAPLIGRSSAVLGALVVGGTWSSLPPQRVAEWGVQLALAARECSRTIADDHLPGG